MGLFDKKKRPEETVKQDGTIVASAYNGSRALVASASHLNLKDLRETDRLAKRLQKTKWQKEAWDYYDLIGEIKFSANLIANVLSRINIYVAHVDDTSRVPATIRDSEASEHADIAEAILRLLESGDGGTSGLLRDAALNYFISGEYYLIKEPADYFRGSPEKYQVRSIDEVVVEGAGKKAKIFVRSSPDDIREDWVAIPDTGFVSRMWRKHPRWSAEADSSMRGILDECDDLLLYTQEARSISRSRIGAGILFVPDGIDNASVPDSDGDEDSEGSDENHTTISEELSEALAGPIGDENHANSVVPVILRGPELMGEKIRLIELAKQIDPMYSNNISFKLDRILQALDIPKDVAKGMANLKYSNGIIIEETLYKSHIEPLILLIIDGLTNGFLRPALAAQGIPDEVIAKTVIWYDPSQITAKPSKSEAANFGIEQNLISASAWRMANAFSDADAPSEEELAQKLVISKLILDPLMSEKLLAKMLPETMKEIREESLGASDPESSDALQEALGGPGGTPVEEGSGGEEGVIMDGPQGPVDVPAPTGLIEP